MIPSGTGGALVLYASNASQFGLSTYSGNVWHNSLWSKACACLDANGCIPSERLWKWLGLARLHRPLILGGSPPSGAEWSPDTERDTCLGVEGMLLSMI